MKKISYPMQRYLDRCAARKSRRTRCTKRSPRRARRRVKSADCRPKEISAPIKFQLLDDSLRRELLDFFSKVEQALADGYHVRIKFDLTDGLHPCGTLVFMARLDKWLENYPDKLTCTYPVDEVVEQLFQHVSVLSKFGLPPRKEISSERVAYWHFYSGSKADPSIFIDMTLAIIEEIDHPNQLLFADCLNEAVCNVVGHAYKHYSEAVLPTNFRKWWIFTQFREERLFVAIYDAGEGIPKTLRRKPEWKHYLRLRNYNDGRIIESAITTNRTTTRQPERGKGLPEMLEFSKSLKDGGLRILSARGGFEYVAQTGEMLCRKFPVSLPGTLVQWTIPFRKGQGHGKDEHLDS